MKDIALCVPEIFYTPRMQEFIMKRCSDNDKQWIYFMIEGRPLKNDEEIFETHASWLLCKDVHQGNDFRMLVIFKDPELKTVRDLRHEHLPLLFEVKRGVREYLLQNMPESVDNFKIYFHYTPSVYQLHAHVSIPGQYYNNWRTHNLNHVISNIKKNTFHYRDAILIFSMSKSIKALNIHKPVEFEERDKNTNQICIDRANTRSRNYKPSMYWSKNSTKDTCHINLLPNAHYKETLKEKKDKVKRKSFKVRTTADIEDLVLKTKA